MDLINRYVYAVTKELPAKQRVDIEKELRTLIEDMLEQQEGPESDEAKLKKVLISLGDPAVLANNYRESKRYLIGPQYFDTYVLVLKIVLGAVFIGVSVAVIVANIFSAQQNIVDILTGYLGSVFSALLQASVWVTVGFYIAERSGRNLMDKKSEKEGWSLSQLPVIPEKKAAISRAESIVSIIFSTVFIAILYFAPQLFAVYISDAGEGLVTIPVFNLELLNRYKLLFVVIFAISVSREVLKLIAGRWTFKVSVVFSVISIAAAVLMLLVFTNPNIWNPDFSAEIMKHTNLSFNFENLWSKVVTVFIIIIAASAVYESASALYKGIRYGVAK